jgi:hypothetical protein
VAIHGRQISFEVEVDFFSGPKPTGKYYAPSTALRLDKERFGFSRRAHRFGLRGCNADVSAQRQRRGGVSLPPTGPPPAQSGVPHVDDHDDKQKLDKANASA